MRDREKEHDAFSIANVILKKRRALLAAVTLLRKRQDVAHFSYPVEQPSIQHLRRVSQ